MASSSSLTPTQTGAILNPSRSQMVMLHMQKEKEGVVPDDNIYRHLPSTLVKDRECNLPLTQEHLLYSVRYPLSGDKDKAYRNIGGTNASWEWSEASPIADSMGGKIGTETYLKLVFNNNGKVTQGNWKAMEYRSLTSDGTSAIVCLTSTDEHLLKLEEKVKQAELQLLDLRQEFVEGELNGSDTGDCGSKIKSLDNKITKMKNDFKQAKDQAREKEDQNAGLVVVPHDVVWEGEKRRKKQT